MKRMMVVMVTIIMIMAMKLLLSKQDGDGKSCVLLAGNVSYSGWCPVAWDDVMCWDHAAPDTAVVKACPQYIHKFKPQGQ